MSAQRWLFQELLKEYGKVDDEDPAEVERFFPHSAGTYVVYDSAAVEAGISISNPCAGMDPCNGACTRTKEAGCQVQRGNNEIHTAVYNFVATVRRQAHVLDERENDDTVKDILESYRPRLNTDDAEGVAVSLPDRELVNRLKVPRALRNALYHALDRNRLPNDVDESVRTKRVQYLLGTFQHRLTLPDGIAAVKKVPNDGDMVFVQAAPFPDDVFDDPDDSESDSENTGDRSNVRSRV